MLNPLRVINRDYVGSDGSRIQLFMTAGNGAQGIPRPAQLRIGQRCRDLGSGTIPITTPAGNHSGAGDSALQAGQAARQRTENDVLLRGAGQGAAIHAPDTQRLDLADVFRRRRPALVLRARVSGSAGHRTNAAPADRNFIGGLWQNIGPILHGTVPGQPEAPPHPSRPANERHKALGIR